MSRITSGASSSMLSTLASHTRAGMLPGAAVGTYSISTSDSGVAQQVRSLPARRSSSVSISG